MLISDRIAHLILTMLNEHDGSLEIRRNDMAERIGCSPSQINYVIRSRFSPELGYLVESRRGEGGYIRIVRSRSADRHSQLADIIGRLPDRIELQEADGVVSLLLSRELISSETASVMRAALIGFPGNGDPSRTATLLSRMLLAIIRS